MKPDQTPSQRRHNNTALQEIIDTLVKSGEGRPPGELAQELVACIKQQGIPAMPDTWVRAVATEAAAGNPYVVSPRTEEELAIPQPDSREEPYSVT